MKIQNKKNNNIFEVINMNESEVTILNNGKEKVLKMSTVKKNYNLIETEEVVNEVAVCEQETVETIEEEVTLTNLEIQFLNGMRTNDYSDILESGGDWMFAVVDETDMNEQQAKGVLTSLKKKGLVIGTWDEEEGETLVSFTDKGAELFNGVDVLPLPEVKEVEVETVKENEVEVEVETTDEVETGVETEPAVETENETELDLSEIDKTILKFIDECDGKLVVKPTKHFTTFYKKVEGGRDKMLAECELQKKSMRFFINQKHLGEHAIGLSDTPVSSIGECTYRFYYEEFNNKNLAAILEVVLNDLKEIILN